MPHEQNAKVISLELFLRTNCTFFLFEVLICPLRPAHIVFGRIKLRTMFQTSGDLFILIEEPFLASS